MKLPLAAGLVCPLAFKAPWSSTITRTTRPNPIFGPLYPDAATDTMRHFDAGVNDVLYGTDGVLGARNARLMAVAASAAIKCEYCVMAQKELARAAGATEEEIETALLLAADLQFRSTLLYGHGYDEDVLKAQIKQMTGG